MNYQKLHIKIFLTSIGILIFSEVIVFLLFRDASKKYIDKSTNDYVSYRATGFKKIIEVLKKNGYKIVKDEEEFVIMERGSEQVYIEGRDIDLCHPYTDCKKKNCDVCGGKK